MRLVGASYLLVAAALALGCSAGGADSAGMHPGAGGTSGKGGSGPSFDGGYVSRSDAAANDPSAHKDASSEPVGSNLTADAVTFNWDTLACLGCSGGGGAGGGSGGSSSGGTSASGSGGKGMGGSSGLGGSAPGADAASPLGGSAAGGAMAGSGGRVVGSGGSTGGGGGVAGTGGGKADAGAIDAGVAPDGARFDSGPPLPSDAAADVFWGSDLPVGGPDARPSDVVGGACQARIVPVIPVLERIDRLVAGENTRVVLRAVVDAGGPGAGSTWTWTQTWQGSPLAVAQTGVVEPDTAAFTVPSAGRYTFSARSGSCYAELAGFAVTPNVCTVCDKSVILRAAPPITSEVPTQSGGMSLDQTSVILSRGVTVKLAASIGSNLVSSYVRVNDTSGGLVADGMSNTVVGGFVTRLRLVDSALAALKYDVLVVPLNGEDDATIAATAPQLYRGRDPTSLNSPLPLAGGLTITGTTLDVNGQPVADARVMLTNQDPAAAKPRADLVFSSVGRSNAQGKYTLRAQPGAYWVSFAPPLDSGLPEVRSDASVTVAGDSTLSFQWSAATTAALNLKILDAMGAPVAGTSVRVTSSSQSSNVGTLSGSLISSQRAKGDVQFQETTDATGTVLFPKLPANADYAVLLMPAAPGPSTATTATAVRVEAGGTSKQVLLSAQAVIKGQLVARSAAAVPIDFTTVSIVGYDRSLDAPEAARAIAVNADGTFAFGVTPNRSYVLVAIPGIGSGYARSFVGPGPLQGSEFVITQNLLTSIAWKAKVVDDSQNGITDTALQAYCDPSWPNCIDPAVPLGETMSDTGGAFQLELADPSSRF